MLRQRQLVEVITMPTHREIAKKLEEFSARELAARIFPNAILLRRGDPNRQEPDFLFRNDGRIIGIEATTASYSNDFLKDDFYIHSHPEELRQKILMTVSVSDPCQKAASLDSLLREKIQARVDSKLAKTYSGCDEVVICIYVHAPLSSEAEIRSILERVSLPISKPATSVQRIAVRFRLSSSTRLVYFWVLLRPRARRSKYRRISVGNSLRSPEAAFALYRVPYFCRTHVIRAISSSPRAVIPSA